MFPFFVDFSRRAAQRIQTSSIQFVPYIYYGAGVLFSYFCCFPIFPPLLKVLLCYAVLLSKQSGDGSITDGNKLFLFCFCPQPKNGKRVTASGIELSIKIEFKPPELSNSHTKILCRRSAYVIMYKFEKVIPLPFPIAFCSYLFFPRSLFPPSPFFPLLSTRPDLSDNSIRSTSLLQQAIGYCGDLMRRVFLSSSSFL